MRAIIASSLALFGLPALAQDGMFVGVGLGSYDYSDSITDPIIGNRSDSVSSYKVYGGFEFNDHVSAEISYGRTDEIEANASGSDPFLGNYTTSSRTEITATTIKAIAQLPREWGVLIGGIGYFDSDSDVELDFMSEGASFSAQGSFRDDGLMAMIGVEWRFGRFGTGYGIRIEYEWWDVDDGDASTIGLGISYRF